MCGGRARNKANAGEQKESIHRAFTVLADRSFMCHENQVRHPKCRKKWSRPPTDSLKLNCDAGFIKTEKTGSCGFIVRDSDGQGLLAGAGRLEDVPDALCAEGYACLTGLCST